MLRVLEECDKVSTDFSADPVHDLRVALRRCRSMADGMIAMDPDRNWMSMKKAGKQLFQRLGSLRDTQIMMDWIDRLLVEESAPSALPEEPATSGPIAGASLASDLRTRSGPCHAQHPSGTRSRAEARSSRSS